MTAASSSPNPALAAATAPPLDHIAAVARQPVVPDTFVGAGGDYGPLRVYGGHLLGQGLAAAYATVSADKLAHSLHAHFLRTGQADRVIAYQVERLRDGRGYATRLVRASQGDQLLMVMTVSCKVPESGDEHQPAMPEVRSAASLRARRERRHGDALALPFCGIGGVAVEAVDDWRPTGHGGPAAIALWMRAVLSQAAGLRARHCALAYLSDGTMMFNALRPHGRAFTSHRATSLDHAVWFHGDADPAEWLLFDQQGPVAADARGLNQGRIFAGDGRLVASVAQEAMMRRL